MQPLESNPNQGWYNIICDTFQNRVRKKKLNPHKNNHIAVLSSKNPYQIEKGKTASETQQIPYCRFIS